MTAGGTGSVIPAGIASCGVAVIVVWVVSFCVPSLLTQDDDQSELMYQVALVTGVLILPAAAGWRWYAGPSRYATGVLVLAFVAALINCCGFVTGAVIALGQL